MQKGFIRFNSITYAQLARETLLKYSVRSQIKRLAGGTGKQGCAYVLFPEGDIYKAHEILNRENIKDMGIEWSGAQ